MKKLILNVFILVLSVTSVWAERVDLSVARQVATAMGAQMRGNVPLRAVGEPELAFIATPGKDLSSLRSTDFNGEADYYVFNYPNQQGFVIVSGEDRAYPILGYSDQGCFSVADMPENIASWLRAYQEQIAEAVKQNWEVSTSVSSEWDLYLNEKSVLRTTKEIVLKTANWGQNGAFNAYSKGFPEMKDGSGKPITGCVATAMGIIMKYHEYPRRTTGNRVSEYQVEKGTTPVKIDYEGDYDWSKMLMEYKSEKYTPEQAEEVSRLLWHAGVNVQMIYDSYENGGSAAETSKAIRALVKVFGYSSSIRYYIKNQSDWAEWKQMIHQEIDANRPIMYGNSEHQFVCDGYNDHDYFHMNWGWNGKANGFYRLSVMSNSSMPVAYLNQDMVINIIPKKDEGLLVPYEPVFVVTNLATENNKQSLALSIAYFAYETSDKFFIGMGVVDAQGKVLNVDNIKLCVITEEFINDNIFFDCKYLLDTSILKPGEMFVPVYSRDQENWQLITSYRNEDKPFIVGVNKDGLVYRTDADIHPDWPTILKNEFDESKLTRIEFTDAYLMDEKYHQANTKGVTFHFPIVGDYEMHLQIADYINWAKHLRVYIGPDPKQMQSMDAEITEEGVCKVKITEDIVQKGDVTMYLKILSDQADSLSYTISLHPMKGKEILDPMLVSEKLTFLIEDLATSNDKIQQNTTQVWAERNLLRVQTPRPCNLRLINMQGICVRAQAITAGITSISLEPGLYIVELGRLKVKVLIP